MTPRVKEILRNYDGNAPGILGNIARLLMSGRLAGTGRLVILPVDQGFEHGPARSFAVNPPGYDPHYHFQLGIDAGCNAYAAPLGFLEAGAAEFAGQIPLILKLNNNDSLFDSKDPNSAITGSVHDALRLGCCAVGYTIYPGSAHSQEMYQHLREIAQEAKSHGLAVVVWSYPRGAGLSKEGETGIDVVAYAADLLGVDPPPEIPFESADLSPMARSFYGENKRVSNKRVKQELGYTFQYPNYKIALQTLRNTV